MAPSPKILVPWVLVAVAGCSQVATPPEQETPDDATTQRDAATSFREAPIVFGSYDPPGTFFVTLADRSAKQVNDIYDFDVLALSPLRTRLVESANGGFQVFEIADEGARVGSVSSPAEGLFEFLGWVDEQTLLFQTTDRVERVGLDGRPRGGGVDRPRRHE